MKRIQSVLEMKPLVFKDMGPCGGFSIQYACYCDYYTMPYREEVIIFGLTILTISVVDPDQDPHGSGTFVWIRIRN